MNEHGKTSGFELSTSKFQGSKILMHHLKFFTAPLFRLSGFTDADMLELSKYITNHSELMDLGIRVLGMGNHQVNSARTNFSCINDASHSLLQNWTKQQSSPQEEFRLLVSRLREVN